MTYIYAIANQKGGVGKTTTAVNLCAYLARAGKRVLLLDLDPQANATSSLGIDKNTVEASSYEVLLGNATATQVTLKNSKLKLAIIPASPALAAAEIELVGEYAREHRLQEALKPEIEKYEYILIDCPPSLSLLTINALTAATDGVLVPVQCEYLALEGLTQLARTVQLVRQRLNPKMDVRGLVMTMYDSRTALAQQVIAEVEKYFGSKVFRTRIPRNVRLSEAPSHGQPIVNYAPNSPGGQAYQSLAKELIEQNDGVQALSDASAQSAQPAAISPDAGAQSAGAQSAGAQSAGAPSAGTQS